MVDHIGPTIDVDQVINLLEGQADLYRDLKLNFVYLAGSLVRGEHAWWSDIDVFVSSSDYIQMDANSKWEFLKRINGEILRRTEIDTIEIRIIEDLPLPVQFSIISEGYIVYMGDKEYYIDFKATCINRYLDHMIWIDQYYKYQEEMAL